MNISVRALLPPPSALRLRLALWCLLVCAVALVLFGALLLAQERAVLLDGLDGQLKGTAALALHPPETTVALPTSVQRRTPPAAVAGAPGPVPSGIVVTIAHADRQGRIRLQDWTAPTQRLAVPLGKTRLAVANATWRMVPTCATHASWRVCTQLAYDQSGRLVSAAQAAAPLAVVQPPLDEMRAWLLVALPLVLVLITVGGWALTGRALAPIDRIRRTAEAIGAGNLAGRLGSPRRDDEVGRLAATFDRMLDRLAEAFARQEQALAQQRAFAAAASHELRTPLAIVKSDLEVLRRGHSVPPEAEEALGGVDEELVRLGRLVENLLTLARADSGQEEVLCDLVALDVLVRTAVADMERLAWEKGLRLETELASTIEVVGDPLSLRQLVLNLLSNAVIYTPLGGSIRVRLVGKEDQAELTIADTGIGIAAEDLPYIFESFYRADKARSRAAGGTGLGLTIARRCAEAHGGRITVESQPGKGSTFVVSLPLAQTDDEESGPGMAAGHRLA